MPLCTAHEALPCQGHSAPRFKQVKIDSVFHPASDHTPRIPDGVAAANEPTRLRRGSCCGAGPRCLVVMPQEDRRRTRIDKGASSGRWRRDTTYNATAAADEGADGVSIMVVMTTHIVNGGARQAVGTVGGLCEGE